MCVATKLSKQLSLMEHKSFIFLLSLVKRKGEKMYKCKQCKKEFPIVAWIGTEQQVMEPTPLSVSPSGTRPTGLVTMIKKPCCPFCHSIELEEIFITR